MQWSECRTKVIQLIDEFSTNGITTTAAQNADYTLRMPSIADAAQKEVATVKKLHSVYSISQNPIYPQNGRFQGFTLQQFTGTDYTVTATGSQAYYFEIDHPATVYIEEQIANVWTIKSTITDTTATSFTAYKGLIVPTSLLNNVRIRFSGLYPYNMRNIALFSQLFASANDVPIYKPYVRYTMPANFFDLNKVIQLTDDRQYVNFADYHWEGRKTIVINYFYTGSFDVYMYVYPAVTIDSSTPDNYVLEVDAEAVEAIPYYIAAHMLLSDIQTRPHGVLLLNIYQQKIASLNHSDNLGAESVQNTSGW